MQHDRTRLPDQQSTGSADSLALASVPSTDSPLMLKLPEAAKLLKISVPTYRRRMWTGELPARKVGGQWRVSYDALRQFAATGVIDSANQVTRENDIERVAS